MKKLFLFLIVLLCFACEDENTISGTNWCGRVSDAVCERMASCDIIENTSLSVSHCSLEMAAALGCETDPKWTDRNCPEDMAKECIDDYFRVMACSDLEAGTPPDLSDDCKGICK